MRSGKLRALAVAGRKRLPALPEVPTIAESGYPGFEASQWYGIVVPARTPPPVVNAISLQVRRALATPELCKQLEAQGAEPTNVGPAEFRALIRDEIDRWQRVVRAAKIEPA